MLRPASILLAAVAALSLAMPISIAHHADTDQVAEAPPNPMAPLTLYHHYLQVGMELEELQQAYPDKMKYKVIGHSVRGLEIYGVEITNFAAEDPPLEDRYRLYFDGSIHSNEQLGMEVSIDIIRWLLQDYETDELAKFGVDNRRTFVVPLVNPDGNTQDSRRNANNIDLNRNFPAGFGGPGSSARGPAPLSEPETQALAGFLKEVRPHYSNSFHTGTLMLLHPWGNYDRESDVVSADHDTYTAICEAILDDMIAAAGGRDVPCGQVFSTIYPASGTTVDYLYEEYGTNSWTFEVDDQQNIPFSEEDIRMRLGEAWVAVRHAFEHVDRYGALIQVTSLGGSFDGDDLVSIDVNLENVGMGRTMNLEIVVLNADGQRIGALGAPDIDAGAQATATVPLTVAMADLSEGTVEVTYNKTLYKGFMESHDSPFTVVASGDSVALSAGFARETIRKVEEATPAPTGLMAMMAVVASVLIAGRRRHA